MDFGSFLRQRQQKQQGSSNTGTAGNFSQESWATNRPPTDVGREDVRRNDPYFGGQPEVSTWNQPDPYHQESVFYEQDADNFGSGPPGFGPYVEPASRGRGFRGRGMRSAPSNQQRGSGSFRGRFGHGVGPEEGEQQTWDRHGDEGGYYKNSGGHSRSDDGSDSSAMKTSTGQDGVMPTHNVMKDQGSDTYNVGNVKETQNVDQQGSEKKKQPSLEKESVDENVSVKKKPPKQEIVRSDEEKKALEEFDIMQVNLNWAHFSITKKMLIEVSTVGKQPVSAKKNYDIAKLEFYCKLCDVQTVSAFNLHDHIAGKKHRMNAENEVDFTNTDIGSEEVSTNENVNSYGGTIGFDIKDDRNDDDKDIEKNKTENNAYEKEYYESFKFADVNVDWESIEVTESMLKEATMSSKVPKYEDRCFDIFNLQFYCRLCDIQSTSNITFHDHLTGKRHKARYTKEVNNINRGITEEAEEDGDGLTEKERAALKEFDLFNVNMNWDHYNITREMLLEANTEGLPGLSQRKRKKKEVDMDKMEFYCKLCAAQMVSAGNFHDHLIGKKHKMAYQEHLRFNTLDEAQRVFLKTEDIGKKSLMELMVTDAKMQVLGLSRISELQSNFQTYFICNLCAIKFHMKAGLSHVLGVKHRLLYMREHAPDVYEKLKRKHEQGLPFYTLLDDHCKERHESDGPGKPIIKHFEKIQEGNVKDPVSYIGWMNSEHDAAKEKFKEKFKDRPASPILNFLNKNTKNDDKKNEKGAQVSDHRRKADHRAHDNVPPHHNRPPHQSRSRHPNVPFPEHGPMFPRHFDDMHHQAPYLERDPPLRARYMERDPLLRDLYMERDPLLRDRYMERDPLLRDRYMDRDPLFRERYMDRDPLFRERYMDRDPLMKDLDRDKGGPYFEPRYRSNQQAPYNDPSDSREMRNRNHRLDPYNDSKSMRPNAEPPYLDPDPLKRTIKKTEHRIDPNPLNRTLKSEPFIDPDPLKRVLPSQKVKAKPVVIDYGHGKEEKSEKSKAKEWEDDINDILDSGRKPKGPDSLALLSSSYSSPKREMSPPEVRPTKALPFERSYLDRAKNFDLVSSKSRPKKRGSDSSQSKRRDSRSPENWSRNPDHPHPKFKRGNERKQSRSPPSKNRKANSSPISISSESPPWNDSPQHAYRNKSPKAFKRTDNPKSFFESRSKGKYRSRSRSPPVSGSRSRSPSSVKPSTSRYVATNKLPSLKSRNYLPFPKQSSPPQQSFVHGSRSPNRSSKRSRSPSGPPQRSRSPFGSSRRQRSPSGPLPKSLPSGPLPTSRSPAGPLPKSLPPLPPLPSSSPPKVKSPDSKYFRNKSPSGPLPTSLPPGPRPRSRSPARMLSRSKSPCKPLPVSLPPESSSKSRASFSPPPRRESKNTAAADEDAQAERIANMLLNMKSSIVGSEMDDPHAALQALLSSKELTEALLATRVEITSNSSPEGRNASGQRLPEKEPAQAKSTREKIAFSFAGKGSVSSRNVPQTFLEEESSDENN